MRLFFVTVVVLVFSFLQTRHVHPALSLKTPTLNKPYALLMKTRIGHRPTPKGPKGPPAYGGYLPKPKW